MRLPLLSHGLWLALATFAFGAAACSAPALVGQVYRKDGLAFRVGEVPKAWRPIDVTQVRIAFRDESLQATVLVNARCGEDAADIPLIALTTHPFWTFTDREVVLQRTEPMDGREAMHTAMRAKLDGVTKMFDVYVMKKDGCVYDFVDISSPDTFEEHRD